MARSRGSRFVRRIRTRSRGARWSRPGDRVATDETGTVAGTDPPAVGGSPPVVELVGIRKYYGATRALNGVSLSVRPSEVVGLVGDNGSGKSTLVKIVTGYHAPTTGRIRYL